MQCFRNLFQRKKRAKGHRKNCAGFSLIEMLVAVALFVVVFVIIGASFITLIEANRKARSTQVAMNNLSFALEEMTRNMRVGTVYHCGVGAPTSPSNCPNGDDEFSFVNSLGQEVRYDYNSTDKSIEKSVNSGSWTAMTSPNIQIDSLRFYVTGALDGDGGQPKVIIVLNGITVLPGGDNTEFDVQTTVVQRVPDL